MDFFGCLDRIARALAYVDSFEEPKRGREFLLDAEARKLCSSHMKNLAGQDEAWILMDVLIQWHVLWLILPESFEELDRGGREFFWDAQARKLCSSHKKNLVPHEEAWIFIDVSINLHVLLLLLTISRADARFFGRKSQKALLNKQGTPS